MSVFLERIKVFAKQKDLSLRQVSLDAGLSGAYLSNSLKQGSTPSVEIIAKIIDNYPELNPSWLLTGKGSMIVKSNLIGEIENSYSINKTIDELIDDKIDIKLTILSPKIREIIAREIEGGLEKALREFQFIKNQK